MTQSSPQFRVKLAQTEDELRAAQRLRYDVFVAELGGSGDMVDHAARLERDAFDPFFDHLLLYDDTLIHDGDPHRRWGLSPIAPRGGRENRTVLFRG